MGIDDSKLKRSFDAGPGATGFPLNLPQSLHVKEVLGESLGTVKACRPDKGFGFIVSEHLQAYGYHADVFLPASWIEGRQVGEEVMFTAILTSADKLQAKDVYTINLG